MYSNCSGRVLPNMSNLFWIEICEESNAALPVSVTSLTRESIEAMTLASFMGAATIKKL